MSIKLGVNIDHVATLRNARDGIHPCPIKAAKLSVLYGADIITFHLREDRRHIQDKDIFLIKDNISKPINFEIANSEEMIKIALNLKPESVCLVPEKRLELTTEGGLNVCNQKEQLKKTIEIFHNFGIKVSLFINPDHNQIDAAKEIKADMIELHTGYYSDNFEKYQHNEFIKLKNSINYANSINIQCNIGHGLNYKTASTLAKINGISEMHVGHFLISESIFSGLEQTIKKFKNICNNSDITEQCENN